MEGFKVTGSVALINFSIIFRSSRSTFVSVICASTTLSRLTTVFATWTFSKCTDVLMLCEDESWNRLIKCQHDAAPSTYVEFCSARSLMFSAQKQTTETNPTDFQVNMSWPVPVLGFYHPEPNLSRCAIKVPPTSRIRSGRIGLNTAWAHHESSFNVISWSVHMEIVLLFISMWMWKFKTRAFIDPLTQKLKTSQQNKEL